MESCLLCLEFNKEFVDCIQVDSTQWLELNIKALIEKHFWIMDTITPSSWLCNTCWQTLYDFHKFYMRIEEAHIDFGKLIPKDLIEDLTRDDITKLDENKDSLINVALNESCLESEILINQLLMEDHKPIIKEEEEQQQLEDDMSDENIPLIKRRKRKHAKLNNDPLKKTRNSKKSSSKRKSKKKENCEEPNSSIDSVVKVPEIETVHIKVDPDIIQISNKCEKSPKNSDSEDSDSFIDYDDDYKPEQDDKEHKNNTKKKQPAKVNTSDSENCDSDVDDKPRHSSTKKHAQTSKQRDQFLAENFEMSCVLCKKIMDNFKNLLKHFEMEHNERGYAFCCNKKFFERGKLLGHVNRHVDPNRYKCNQCGKLLTTQKALENHQLIHVSEEEKKFACTECGNTYVEQKKLTVHINRVHLRLYVKVCDICGKRLRCGEAFQRHMLEHEGKPLPTITCKFCGLRVSTKHGLRRHTLMQHPVDGKKDHVCNICFKVSPNSYALRKHINSTHKAQNNHMCTMCGRGFKRPLALREHMATHTGIALYNCPWCPKTFNASGGMHAHRKTQHPVEWEETRRQRKLERYNKIHGVMETNSVTETNSNTSGTDFKVDLGDFNKSVADFNVI